MNVHRSLAVVGAALLGLAAARPATLPARDVRVRDIDGLKAALRSASPGTRIVLAPGTYRGGCFLKGYGGSASSPIVIEAQDPARPPRFLGGNVAFQMVECQYLIVDGIDAAGAETNNVQIGDGSHHIVLRRVRSGPVGPDGNNDGFKLPGLTDFLLDRCQADGWGGGGSAVDMVGCARGLLVECRFGTPKPGGGEVANGVQLKGGSSNVGVFRCRFDGTDYRALQFGGLTGENFFFQGNGAEGVEALDSVAFGNLFLGGESAIAFASSRDCAAEYNTILRPRTYVVRLLKEGRVPPTGNRIAHNLIVSQGLGQPINVGSGVDAASALALVEDYWFDPTSPKSLAPKTAARVSNPAGGVDPQLDDLGRPAPDSPSSGYGSFAEAIPAAWDPYIARFPWAWKQAVAARRPRPAPAHRSEER